MNSDSVMLWLGKISLLTLFAWNVTLFTRALQKGFTRPAGVPLLMRLMGICAALTATVNVIVVLFVRALPAPRLGCALASLVVSQIIFRLATRATCAWRLSLAFSDDVPNHLNEKGPYRWIRHPFYTSYLLTWIGGTLATAQIASVVALVGMTVFYCVAAVREERKFLNSPLATIYRHYQQSAGMFFPRLRSLFFPQLT